jgi:hypothetical protein
MFDDSKITFEKKKKKNFFFFFLYEFFFFFLDFTGEKCMNRFEIYIILKKTEFY